MNDENTKKHHDRLTIILSSKAAYSYSWVSGRHSLSRHQTKQFETPAANRPSLLRGQNEWRHLNNAVLNSSPHSHAANPEFLHQVRASRSLEQDGQIQAPEF